MSQANFLNFDIQGNVSEFIFNKDLQIKALKINNNQHEYKIKIPKEVSNSLDKNIKIGSLLKIKGTKKVSHKTDNIKLKASHIDLITLPKPAFQCPINRISSGTILVCKKSTCWQRGGQAICQILEEHLQNHGLENSINIKTTGCLKKCKQGPNVIFMPQKNHYTKVQPQEIPALLTQNNLL